MNGLQSLWICALAVISYGLAEAKSTIHESSPLVSEIEHASNQSLLWGPYRPNLYFGVRPRIPKSLMMGLMWAKVDNFGTAQGNFRHTCEQNEGMAGYGWEEYDIRNGGRQTIHDAGNTLDLTIDFIKVPGGNHGGSWAARIKGNPRRDAPPNQPTTLIFYTTMEGLGELGVGNEIDPLGFQGDVKLFGSTVDLGEFTIDITRGPDTNRYPQKIHPSYDEKPMDRTFVASFQLESELLWQAKEILFTHLKQEVEPLFQKYGTENPPPPSSVFTIANKPAHGNFHLIQKTFEGPFEFDILFSSASASEPVTSDGLSKGIKSVSQSFTERFQTIYSPAKPFGASKYMAFSKAMLSNLVGGIGYFHGDSIVDRSNAPEYEEENEGFWEEAAEARAKVEPTLERPSELFTSIPSRPFFPRGFLWDEGFHLMPIIDWDLDLSLQIVESWFKLMDDDGWIAREQILGPEARSKVPAEFQVQYPHYANPPTLFMILDELSDKMKASAVDPGDIRSLYLKNPEAVESYLRSIYPLLKRQYFWFKKTQWGDIKSYDREAFSMKEGYRWRGRTVEHILTSGLDDYPRAQPPHPGELHVDLISWMGLMTRSLRRIAHALGEQEDVEELGQYENAIKRNIDDLHWDEATKTYCDATVDEFEESVHVCHKGYISISPFWTGMLAPDDRHLKHTLDLISDPEELWSDYGIRSLSKKDEFYGTGENYWRSPIWININYLILKNLLRIANVSGLHQKQAGDMYTKLRRNLVENVFNEWERTGFAWEQYNPESGHGQRTQHFTGWTSLVVKIMVMPEIPNVVGNLRDEL
ncbi:Processing alpha glucosidase I [Ophidiomyces ophidiicola]|uniref:Processing alpha glucosidase I n=1 Tax=Ophidiomyces ophidiicola TaxID=1387563 RepID=A0ACB8V430_9EURO|nr:Processing alpha glucosidase I [Ophidiomyces ophidiicola]KAI1914025.1 Processing alpha glucosidase I [Ophidiomyces ophidiicola]KAI1921520.1 Processing alpha glucosidase I [Ophidiomyces ophidiicola]KAI1929528.1 Processing alpha glucosidase I [Ophidiomyces ophidiicola]KAI1948944.1 Processing alpha glucosidase I [Ophidiomyces ophidiicola]KAI1951170.1 Processing alpha glucosidase I [Ophidiomyces ophidiicola]